MQKSLVVFAAIGMIGASATAAQACMTPVSAEEMRRGASVYYWMKDGPMEVFSGKVAKPHYCSPGSLPETRTGERNDKYFGMGYFADHGAKGKR